jgi:bifunctional non-homologous end joining protein LigD
MRLLPTRLRMATVENRCMDFSPMLLNERPIDLDASGWLFELKFDGYRLMARFGSGACTLKTRNGANATQWFPEIADELAEVPGGPYVTDGEVCVMDDLGRSDFNRLQVRAKRRKWYTGADLVVYCVFDLLVEARRRHHWKAVDRAQAAA